MDRDKLLESKKHLETVLDNIDLELGFKEKHKKNHILELCRLVGITQEELAEGIIMSKTRNKGDITKAGLSELIGVSRPTLNTYDCVKCYFAKDAKDEEKFDRRHKDYDE